MVPAIGREDDDPPSAAGHLDSRIGHVLADARWIRHEHLAQYQQRALAGVFMNVQHRWPSSRHDGEAFEANLEALVRLAFRLANEAGADCENVHRVRVKQSMASAGVHTIGSFSLKLVFKSTGMSGLALESPDQVVVERVFVGDSRSAVVPCRPRD